MENVTTYARPAARRLPPAACRLPPAACLLNSAPEFSAFVRLRLLS
jgi:hypothetical protein